MRKAKGYIADDGSFFEHEEDAEKHDAEMVIRTFCTIHHVDAEKLLSYVEALAEPIKDYLNADAKVKARNSPQAEVASYQTDDEEQA